MDEIRESEVTSSSFFACGKQDRNQNSKKSGNRGQPAAHRCQRDPIKSAIVGKIDARDHCLCYEHPVFSKEAFRHFGMSDCVEVQ